MYRLTTISRVSIALTLFAGLLALIFQGHLLVYTAILLMTANVTIFVWSIQCSRGITLVRHHTSIAPKGHQVRVVLTLRNNTRSPRFLLFGFDHFSAGVQEERYKAVVFRWVGAFSETSSAYSAVAAKRGVFELGPFYLYSGDPLGFFRHIRRIGERTKLTVVPVPLPLKISRLHSTSHIPKDELPTVSVPGQSTEFLGVREYAPGDSLRKIHWLSSARLGGLITKQFEKNVASTLSVLLVNDEKSAIGKLEEHTPLEYSILIASTLANEIVRKRGYFAFLELNGGKGCSISGSEPQFFQRFSLALAQIKPGRPFSVPSYSSDISKFLPSGSDLIVLIPRLSPVDAEFFSRLRLNYRVLSVICFDLESFRRGSPKGGLHRRISFGLNYLIFEIAFGDNLSSRLEQFIEKVGVIR